MSPSAGSGAAGVFRVDFIDPGGAAHFRSVRVLVNGMVDGSRACYVYYVRQRNSFLLVDDAGLNSTALAVGGGGSVQNGQCRLDGAGSSASAAADRLSIRLNLTFFPSFYGEKQIFLASDDIEGKSTTLDSSGSWTVP